MSDDWEHTPVSVQDAVRRAATPTERALTARAVEIRATHPDGFRSGQWAVITGIEWRNERQCWQVRFPDHVTDSWVVFDPSDPYEFRPAPLDAERAARAPEGGSKQVLDQKRWSEEEPYRAGWTDGLKSGRAARAEPGLREAEVLAAARRVDQLGTFRTIDPGILKDRVRARHDLRAALAEYDRAALEAHGGAMTREAAPVDVSARCGALWCERIAGHDGRHMLIRHPAPGESQGPPKGPDDDCAECYRQGWEAGRAALAGEPQESPETLDVERLAEAMQAQAWGWLGWTDVEPMTSERAQIAFLEAARAIAAKYAALAPQPAKAEDES